MRATHHRPPVARVVFLFLVLVFFVTTKNDDAFDTNNRGGIHFVRAIESE